MWFIINNKNIHINISIISICLLLSEFHILSYLTCFSDIQQLSNHNIKSINNIWIINCCVDRRLYSGYGYQGNKVKNVLSYYFGLIYLSEYLNQKYRNKKKETIKFRILAKYFLCIKCYLLKNYIIMNIIILINSL